MPLPTQPVTCRFNDQSGNPVAGARATFRLTSTEVYDGIVAPELVEATADATGECVVNLFPNALGVNGSQYIVKAWNPDTGGKFLDVLASVPNSPSLLHQIMVQEPYPPVDQAAAAMLEAQAALALVTAQRILAEDAATDAGASEVVAASAANSAAASALAAQTSGSAVALSAALAGSGGAGLVGFRTGTVADALASWPTLDQYLTPSELAAAISGAVVDMTTSLQAALTANKFVRAVSGRTYRFTTLNMAQADACLYLGAGSVMAPSSPTVTGINVSGARCSIVGEGAITSPATFNGTNARRTYATIWVTGEGFTLRDVTLNNIPRCGIHFEDAAGWLVQNVTFNGNTPYSFYTGTEVGHIAIDYNPPTTAGATDFQSGRVLGCRIRQCVQGVFYGNFDSYGSTAGVVVVGNVFESCWNHGIYLTLAEASTITGNTFLDCQVPIVTDGNGCVISGNTLYTTEPSTRTNSWQVIQVREARNTRIVDNVLIGPDAGISLECVSGTDISGNSIEGNTIVRTARAATGFVIRLGNGASTCRNNRISNNTITGTMGLITGNVIELTMLAGNFGFDNEVIDNTIEMTDPCQLLQIDRHRRTIVKDNKFQCAGSTASAETIRMMQIIDSIGCAVTDNRFIWETGGTNITVRGIQADGTVTGTRYEDNVFDLTATFASESTIQNIGGGGQTYTRNLLDGGNSALIGSAIIVAGTPSITVTNGNCLIGYSRVFLQPLDASAGALPVYVTIANGSFTILTASGGNAAANSAYAWELK